MQKDFKEVLCELIMEIDDYETLVYIYYLIIGYND